MAKFPHMIAQLGKRLLQEPRRLGARLLKEPLWAIATISKHVSWQGA